MLGFYNNNENLCVCKVCGSEWGLDEMGTTVECPVCGADEIIFPMKNNGDNGKEPVTDEEIEAFMASNTWYTKKIYKLGRGVTVKGIVKEIKKWGYSDVSFSMESNGKKGSGSLYNIGIKGNCSRNHCSKHLVLNVLYDKDVTIQVYRAFDTYQSWKDKFDTNKEMTINSRIVFYNLFKILDEYVEKMNKSFNAKICPHCGEEIVGKGKFCANCGATL